ncbi:gamma-glutamyltransferase [Numidum massiliense]|uniref:gamma-glutamyltransferase n=1 Tax=Numidum massiliense TaxID=1522315 RepID=UPI0006D5AF8A
MKRRLRMVFIAWLTLLTINACSFSFKGSISQVFAAEDGSVHGERGRSRANVSDGANGARSEQVATGDEGMVVTAHPAASRVGADILKKGGNAVDAAVAVQFALNVAEPMMSGIGGGFMMVYNVHDQNIRIINSREKAPGGATPDMFLDDQGKIIPFPVRSTSGKAVGVPGTLKGVERALEEWGTMSLAELIEPAVQLADQGVEVNRILADAIADHADKLRRTAAKDVFLPNGEPLAEGDLLVQKDLAKTFKLIQEEGTDVFYEGAIGAAIAETVQQFGGAMELEDLSRYEVKEEVPLWGSYRGYDIATMPPPSSGGVTLLQMLQLLEPFNMRQYDVRATEKYHLVTEAMHLAYADRGAYIGDPTFVDVPVEGMLHPDYIAERHKLIDLNRANDDVQPGDPWHYQEGTRRAIVPQLDDRPLGETTHFTVADRWGNLVVYTTTIEQLFGTGIMVPEYGIILNNELTDFDARPGGPNEVQPYKRPMSSMTPTIVFANGQGRDAKHKQPLMTVGSPGGATIIASVLQVTLHVLDFDMGLKDAIEEQRIYSNNYPQIRWEEGIPDAVRQEMVQLGHEWEPRATAIGNVQSIMINRAGTRYLGAADSSREGSAIGLGKANIIKK